MWNVPDSVNPGLVCRRQHQPAHRGHSQLRFLYSPTMQYWEFIYSGRLQREERGTSREVILFSSETEDNLLSSTFYTLLFCANMCDLGRRYSIKLSPGTHLLQWACGSPWRRILISFWKVRNLLSPCWDVLLLRQQTAQIVDSPLSRLSEF